jgi:hypothetical protein
MPFPREDREVRVRDRGSGVLGVRERDYLVGITMPKPYVNPDLIQGEAPIARLDRRIVDDPAWAVSQCLTRSLNQELSEARVSDDGAVGVR